MVLVKDVAKDNVKERKEIRLDVRIKSRAWSRLHPWVLEGRRQIDGGPRWSRLEF